MKDPQVFAIRQSSAGFTLVELLVAAVISTIVIGIAGFGLITILDANKKAEARTRRRMELNRALDFISDDVRMARRVNRATDHPVGASTAITDSRTAYGAFSPSLGSIGNPVLYLEIPLPPTTCTGISGPAFAGPTIDRVVYDIRPNTSTWLGPRTINRYGRLLRNNGTIDSCKNPVASEVLADSVSDIEINVTCNVPAIKSGIGGFQVCVQGRHVELYLRSRVSDTETYDLSTKVFPRTQP